MNKSRSAFLVFILLVLPLTSFAKNETEAPPQDEFVVVDINRGPCYGRTVCDENNVLKQQPNAKVGQKLNELIDIAYIRNFVNGHRFRSK